MTFCVRQDLFALNSEGNKIYKVISFGAYEDSEVLYLNLQLLYILKNGIWSAADSIPEDEKYETVTQFFLSESAEEALVADDYTVITDPQSLLNN